MINNLKKKLRYIISLIINYPIYFISGLIPRNSNRWVFGSFGNFNENSKYLFVHLLKNPDKSIQPIWISKSKQSVELAQAAGGLAYHPWHPLGLYYCFTAKVYIYSSYLTDINFFTSCKAVKVNLWHGIPLKKIEFDIDTPPTANRFKYANRFTKILFPHIHIRPDILLSPSEYVATYSFESAFRVNKENILIANYPRVTELINCQPDLSYDGYHKVFLYAPTWRDQGNDFIAESQLDFVYLNEMMEQHNSIFLLKLHPATNLTNIDLKKFKNIKLLDNKTDSNQILKTADCLITDYSSIYFDYLVLNKPIIFFTFDLETYLSGREMYFQLEDVTPGPLANNVNLLIQSMTDILSNKDCYGTKRKEILNKFMTTNTISNNHKIINFIKNKIQ